ncbi:hypothetical protein GCK72_008646 [Caenorhabditis remanei]|uniref:Uncharacterized protein n=1 Tax=Caenorhabditis remanei TaxID=31234 RepID=A0A6A5GZ98_CAERE|nr:hypothetical protein GCK72_008646 [Caenorhabditis remanei]KAF1760397.1 hypothetical protein GCK72_008646 [Caenorhabditis remanei]
MLNLKFLGFCVIIVALALVFADNDGGAGDAKNAVASGNGSAAIEIKGQVFCPSKENQVTDCGEGSFAHTHKCCGDGEKECCFALQVWVYIALAVLVLCIIISTIIGIFCCCCKK